MRIESIEKLKPEVIPHNAHWVILFHNSKFGMTRATPQKVMIASITLGSFNFSLKKIGSRKVVKTGKVENVSNQTATVDTWTAWKNVVQWIAKTTPRSARKK